MHFSINFHTKFPTFEDVRQSPRIGTAKALKNEAKHFYQIRAGIRAIANYCKFCYKKAALSGLFAH
ncbi:hypothetical protein ACKFKF_20340 [Phormidesmis sp. 146-12]